MIFHLIVKNVLFGSSRQTSSNNIHFTRRVCSKTYTRLRQLAENRWVTEGGIEYARYNAAGNQIVFKTAKGTKMPYVNTTPTA
jgi:hypothetical protein